MELRTKPSVSAGILSDIRSGENRHVVYAPGNGTRYDLLLVPCKGLNVAGADESAQMVVMLNGLCRAYSFSGYAHWSYVGEKLGMNKPDAMVISELLEYLLEGKDTTGTPEEN